MSGRRFEAVFTFDSQGRDGKPRFRIAGSGIHGPPCFAPLTDSVVEALRSQGIQVKERSLGSPGNVDSYHLDASFSDGGLRASTGNYWIEQRGAWVVGEEAVCCWGFYPDSAESLIESLFVSKACPYSISLSGGI